MSIFASFLVPSDNFNTNGVPTERASQDTLTGIQNILISFQKLL